MVNGFHSTVLKINKVFILISATDNLRLLETCEPAMSLETTVSNMLQMLQVCTVVLLYSSNWDKRGKNSIMCFGCHQLPAHMTVYGLTSSCEIGKREPWSKRVIFLELIAAVKKTVGSRILRIERNDV